MTESTECGCITVYGIGRPVTDLSNEVCISRLFSGISNGTWNSEFPPLFLTKEEALSWISARHFTNLVVVPLMLQFNADKMVRLVDLNTVKLAQQNP